ncbi:MAG: TIGR00730 family Rossman fold protein [Clostridia bacterium]|nr:TIGR00730 family Rossman fold protein [Clostridia bacterium]
MRICVYGAASPTIDKEYFEKVEYMGSEMAKRGHSLVFGGGGNGLMGAAARGVRAEGGYIMGVIPKFFDEENVEAICDFCDELIMPDTMRQRKQIMEDNADAFIVVPGGIGTYEEFFEILTLKQLCRHNKPIAIYNIKNYYAELIETMEKAM